MKTIPNFFMQKTVVASPVIVFLVVVFFSLAMIPSIRMAPRNLPIAIVNADQGITLPNKTILHLGTKMIENIQLHSKPQPGETAVVKWITAGSEEEVISGMNERKYYAALIIPPDFSAKQSSLQGPAPVSPEIHLLINQGMNVVAANTAGQILNQIIDNVNATIKNQILDGIGKAGGTLTVAQATMIASPITKKVTTVNVTGNNSAGGNAPVMLVQPVFLSSLIAAVLLFLALKKRNYKKLSQRFLGLTGVVLTGIVLAFIAGFGLIWIAGGWFGLDIASVGSASWFAAISFFSFLLLWLALLTWFNLPGLIIIPLLFFFGFPLLVLPPEFLTSFYSEWIYSWIPMRFVADGFRDILFFRGGLTLSSPMVVILGIAIGSILTLFGSVLRGSRPNLPKALPDETC